MNNETITITRNGKTYEVDFEKAEELGILKEKMKYPKSFEDFATNIDTAPGDIVSARELDKTGCYDTFDTTTEATAFIALGKLIQLRDWWWDNICSGWRPGPKGCFAIMNSFHKYSSRIIPIDSWGDSYVFSFPEEEIRDKFLDTYKDLIEQAKMFL